jgi:predicted anti-sigma-YlaC factor YlaD
MTRLISAGREESHSWLTRLRMRRHLGVCVWCRRYQDQVGFIGTLCSMFAEQSVTHGEDQLSDEARVRLKRALKQHGHE